MRVYNSKKIHDKSHKEMVNFWQEEKRNLICRWIGLHNIAQHDEIISINIWMLDILFHVWINIGCIQIDENNWLLMSFPCIVAGLGTMMFLLFLRSPPFWNSFNVWGYLIFPHKKEHHMSNTVSYRAHFYYET